MPKVVKVAAAVTAASEVVTSAATEALQTVADFAVETVRSLVLWQNTHATAFLTSGGLPWSDPSCGLTGPQRANVFSYAMSLCGVGLSMPKVEGKHIWDTPTFERGMALADGREIVEGQYVHQTYAPLVAPKKPKRHGFSDMLVSAARAGMLQGINPADLEGDVTDAAGSKVLGPDGKPLSKARQWYSATIKVLTEGDKSPLVATGRSIAVRADLTERPAKSKASKLTDRAAIEKELRGE